jgi:uncharacterized glyoxalase superfamily protein PhnB
MARISRIAPELPVRDLQSALIFYEQKLGFETSMRMPNYAVVERDGVAIHLFHQQTDGHQPAGVHIFTADLEGLCDELRQRGAHFSQEILRKPWGNRDFRIKDESGNELKFTEPLAGENG